VFDGTGAAVRVALRYDLRLSELKKFVRFVITPAFTDATVTSNVDLHGEAILGGASVIVTRNVSWSPAYLS
jgi:hypothetical protein